MVQDSVGGAKMNISESEGRKWSKPIMEKRRRERINKSLDELKRLVLEAQNRDSSRYTKLEKADILEMTVKHLRGLRSRRKSASIVASQSLIPGCCRCLIDVGHGVIPDHVLMKSRESHVVGISTNAQDSETYINDTLPLPNGIARDHEFTSGIPAPDSQGVVAHCQPLHVNTAVQFIPICSSHLSNSNTFPGAHIGSSEPYCLPNGEQFWRPF